MKNVLILTCLFASSVFAQSVFPPNGAGGGSGSGGSSGSYSSGGTLPSALTSTHVFFGVAGVATDTSLAGAGIVAGAGSLTTNKAVTCGNGSGSVADCATTFLYDSTNNVTVPSGSAAHPGLNFSGNNTIGAFYDSGNSTVTITLGGGNYHFMVLSSQLKLPGNEVLSFSNTSFNAAAAQTASLTPDGLGSSTLDFGTGAGGSGGSWKAANGTLSGSLNIGGVVSHNQNGLATSTVTTSLLQNTTVSTSGATVQITPAQEFDGHAWNTTATAADNFTRMRNYCTPISSGTPTITCDWDFSIDTGAPSWITKMTLSSAGALTLSSGITSTSGTIFAQGGSVQVANAGGFIFTGRSIFLSLGDGLVELTNNAQTDFSRLQFGGTTSSFPALKRSSATLAVRLADDSGDAPISTSALNNTGSSFTFNGHTCTIVSTVVTCP